METRTALADRVRQSSEALLIHRMCYYARSCVFEWPLNVITRVDMFSSSELIILEEFFNIFESSYSLQFGSCIAR
jgi:hypothetical protein